jgi:hypothetical protein
MHGMICAARSVSSSKLCSDAGTTKAPVDSDLPELATQLVISAIALRASVLSLDVLGKSSSEIQKQIEMCNDRQREMRNERIELVELQKQTRASIQNLEKLMRYPDISREDEEKIKSKLEELGHLHATLKERYEKILDLEVHRLWDEKEVLQNMLEQLDSKK